MKLISWIMKHYGISAKVVNGKKHMENSVVIAGKKYTASTLETSANADKTYTTTTILGLAVNRVTMVLFKGSTGTFKVIGQSKGITWSSSNTKVAVVNAQWQSDGKGYRHSQSNIESKTGKTFLPGTVCCNPMKRLKGEIERMRKSNERRQRGMWVFAKNLMLVTPASVEAATKNEELNTL